MKPLVGKISRRDVLKALPVAAVLASCRRSPYDGSEFAIPSRSPVALFAAPTYDVDLAEIITRGFKELNVDLRGKRVLLKPNIVEYAPGAAINTHPMVVGGAAVASLRAGAREVVVAEGPGHRRDIEYLLQATGFATTLADVRVRFVDLNHDDVRVMPLKSHFTTMTEMAFPVELLNADFIISMPKLKTHHWAGMTASMKNFFGVVPGAVYGWPKNILHLHGIDNSIVDLVATVKPHFSIVDAVVGMEGDGPIMGTPRQTGFVAMGSDLVAVDATCARLIGLDATKLPYLAIAGEFLGNINERRIEHRGESPDRYRTRFAVLEQFRGYQLATGG